MIGARICCFRQCNRDVSPGPRAEVEITTVGENTVSAQRGNRLRLDARDHHQGSCSQRRFGSEAHAHHLVLFAREVNAAILLGADAVVIDKAKAGDVALRHVHKHHAAAFEVLLSQDGYFVLHDGLGGDFARPIDSNVELHADGSHPGVALGGSQ